MKNQTSRNEPRLHVPDETRDTRRMIVEMSSQDAETDENFIRTRRRERRFVVPSLGDWES